MNGLAANQWWARPEGRAAAVRLAIGLPLGAWLASSTPSLAQISPPLLLTLIAYLVYALTEMVLSVAATSGPTMARSRLGLLADLVGLSSLLLAGGDAAAPLLPLYLLVVLGHGLRRSWVDQLIAVSGGVAGMATYLSVGDVGPGSMAFSMAVILMTVVCPFYLKLVLERLEAERARGERQLGLGAERIADLRHELRTPLQGVIGACEVLRFETTDSQQRRLTDAIEESAWLQLELINNALAAAETNPGSGEGSERDFDLHKLISLVIRLAELRLGGTGMQIAVNVSPQVPSRVRGDDVFLPRVLLSMLDRLVRRHPGVGLVMQVSATTAPNRRVRVRFDLGVGDSLDVDGPARRGVFEPSVARMVEALGGLIESFGAGNTSPETMRLEVPLMVCADEPGPTSDGPSRILVVGETLMARRLEAMALSWRASVEHETSSARAFARLSRAAEEGRLFSAVFVQRHHIAMTPGAFVKSLQGGSGLQDLPVILIDSSFEPDERREFLAAGYAAVLSEPLDAASVFGALQGAQPIGMRPGLATDPDQRSQIAPLQILVAEDNHTNALLLQRMLEHAGHEVHLVEDGQAALEELLGTGSDLDLAIMDFNMPKLDGLTAIRRYHKACEGPGRVPVLLLTASDSGQLRRDCEAEGIVAVLSKPVDYSGLIASIQMATSDARLTHRIRAVAEASLGARSVLDVAKLDSVSELDPTNQSLVREIVEVFQRDGAQMIERLAVAVRSGDSCGIESAVHALRGTALELGATVLAERCSIVKKVLVSGAAQTEVASRVTDVSDAFSEASAALEDYLQRSSNLLQVR